MKRYTKGFTLIELLVVIAIIGILASVVLVSLQSARKKGNDTRVLSSVQQLRTALESDYDGTSYENSFTVAAGGGAYGFKAASPYNTLITDIGANGFTGAPAYAYVGSNVNGNSTAGLIVVTNGVAGAGSWSTKPTAYAIRGKLPSTGTTADAAKSFCIDSTGKATQSEAAPAAAAPYLVTCQ
jgi:prepilin-type N-terminal cleavage/methylation domain-containing protein